MPKYYIINIKVILALILLSSCSLSDLVNKAAIPVDSSNPNEWENKAGAIGLYNGARKALQGQLAMVTTTSILSASSMFTDELGNVFSANNPANFPTTGLSSVDARSVPDWNGALAVLSSTTSGAYSGLQSIRVQAKLAIGYMKKFEHDISRDFFVNAYAIDAYATLMLAEMFCSGVPLSRIHYDGTYVLGNATSYEETLKQALSLTDTALLYRNDSTNFVNFARVLRARIFTSMALYDSAAAASELIPADFKYAITYNDANKNFFQVATNGTWSNITVSDKAGLNGLNYVSSNDPRTSVEQTATGVLFPKKYSKNGVSSIIIASGVEALLYRAEAKLHAGEVNGWLQILNNLRNNGISQVNTINEVGVQDTVWYPGVGANLFKDNIVSITGLRDLTDPGSDSARVSLLFRERAFWLFLTGHRQGDLRRLVRNYHRDENEVYPTGSWGPTGSSSYGLDKNFPVPYLELTRNKNYGGCISRDA